jgi:putative aminopeptidase FrvX
MPKLNGGDEMSVNFIENLVKINSPSGYTKEVIDFVAETVAGKGYELIFSNKGSLLVTTSQSPERVVAAHVDTLGAMVSKVKSDGTLELTQLGGWPPNSFEGEYCAILTAEGKLYRGAFLLNNPAAHVNHDIAKTERSMEKMHVRLDAVTFSQKETEALGIGVGDFIFFDPRFEVTDTGFVKSRFMDDKACAGVLLDILVNHAEEIKKHSVGFYFSTYEEVGHGGTSGIPQSVKELLIADMGVVGEGVTGKETAVSICAKDSSGPYDYAFRQKLVSLAKENNISYTVDVFPYYGSDGSAALRAGYDVRVGLIGPGVSASHGVERTHKEGIEATKKLILAWVNG